MESWEESKGEEIEEGKKKEKSFESVCGRDFHNDSWIFIMKRIIELATLKI